MELFTMSDRAAEKIRTMILNGDLKPGGKINIDKLSRESDFSKTPIREALNKLIAEGLVAYTPRVGYTVYLLSLKEYFQLYELQEMLEVHLTLRMLQFVDSIDFDKLEEANLKIQESMATGNTALVQVYNDRFHMGIYQNYPNPKLIEELQQIWAKVKIQRHMMYRSTVFLGTVLQEHRDIANGLKNGDPAKLELAVRKHFRSGGEALLKSLG
jgi:DNA-binding GntR family transcriptional regulator